MININRRLMMIRRKLFRKRRSAARHSVKKKVIRKSEKHYRFRRKPVVRHIMRIRRIPRIRIRRRKPSVHRSVKYAVKKHVERRRFRLPRIKLPRARIPKALKKTVSILTPAPIRSVLTMQKRFRKIIRHFKRRPHPVLLRSSKPIRKIKRISPIKRKYINIQRSVNLKPKRSSVPVQRIAPVKQIMPMQQTIQQIPMQQPVQQPAQLAVRSEAGGSKTANLLPVLAVAGGIAALMLLKKK